MKIRWKYVFKQWLPMVVLTTILCGTLYVVAQQILRAEANDPQIQISEDIAAGIADGENPESLLPEAQVDIGKSTGIFATIYDKNGKILTSTALLESATPTVPPGVLEAAHKRGQNRITWQPKTAVRAAIIVTEVAGEEGGFVLVGRSLRETEERIQNIIQPLVLFGWITALMASFLTSLIVSIQKKHRIPPG